MARDFTPKESAIRRLWFNFKQERGMADSALDAFVANLDEYTDEQVAAAVERYIADAGRNFFPRFAEFKPYLPSLGQGDESRRSWAVDGSLTGDWSRALPVEALRIAGICWAYGTRRRSSRTPVDVFELAKRLGVTQADVQLAAKVGGTQGVTKRWLQSWLVGNPSDSLESEEAIAS